MRGLGFLRRVYGILFSKPPNIIIETSSACNARCVWCWMYVSKRKKAGFIDRKSFEKFIDLNVAQYGKVPLTPYFRGEPLLHKEFFEMVEYAAEKGWRLMDIHSNLAVDTDLERLSKVPFRQIIVNVGGTTKESHEAAIQRTSFEKVTANLKELFPLARKSGLKVYVKMNVTKHNVHLIDELPNFVASLGGDPEKAQVNSTGFPLPALATEEETKTFFDSVVSPPVVDHLRFTFIERDGHYEIKTIRGPFCKFLHPVITYSGDVTVCCHDHLGLLKLGNAFEKPLAEILGSWAYKKAACKGLFRQLSFCPECN